MYVTVAEFREFAEGMGATLPASDTECLILLNKASLFIDSQDDKLKGTRTERNQPYAYPRKNLEILGWKYDADEIPDMVKKCQMAFALEAHDGIDIFAPKADLPVVSEQVDVIHVQYANPTDSVKTEERESFAMSLLRQLIGGGNAGIGFIKRVRT